MGTRAHTHTFTHIHSRTCIYTTPVHAFIHASTHVHKHMHVRTHMCSHTYIDTYTSTHLHSHLYNHHLVFKGNWFQGSSQIPKSLRYSSPLYKMASNLHIIYTHCLIFLNYICLIKATQGIIVTIVGIFRSELTCLVRISSWHFHTHMYWTLIIFTPPLLFPFPFPFSFSLSALCCPLLLSSQMFLISLDAYSS
jgi:hypothetical protein